MADDLPTSPQTSTQSALPAAFLLIDADLQVVAASPTSVPLLGLEVARLLGRPLREVLPDARVDSVAQDIFSGHSTDLAFEVEVAGLYGISRLQVDFAQLLSRRDLPLVVVGLTDLSGLEETRSQLAAMRERLDGLVHQLPGAVIRCLVAPGLPVRFAEGGLDQLGDRALSELPGTRLTDHISRESAQHLLLQIEQANTSGQPLRAVLELAEGTGCVDLQGRVSQEEGELYLEAFLTDGTERRALEHQLRHSQKMEAVGRLAGALAHDFNNLLAVMLTRCDLMLIRTHGDSALEAGLNQVRGAAERAAGLIRQLQGLAVAGPPGSQAADAVAVVQRTLAILQPLFQEGHVLVADDLEDVGWVSVDGDRLEQLLLNLVLNAREALPASGRVDVSLRTLEGTLDGLLGGEVDGPLGYALLEVRDDGPGMDRLTAERAFDPYFTTRKGRGTGLGLSIVHGIVQEAGGDLRLETAPGRGACFQVALPRVLSPPSITPVSEAPAGTGRRARILVVDDDEGVRRSTVDLLEAVGHEVHAAASGEAGLELARQQRFELVLTDVVMPGMGGRALAAALRRTSPGLPVVFMSGHTDDEILDSGIAAGRERLLRKPFRKDVLFEFVQQALGR